MDRVEGPDEDRAVRLAEHWVAAVRALGGGGARAVADELVAAYGSGRHYHDLAHVDQVVRDVGWLAVEVGLEPVERCQVELAALAHDVVYDGVPGQDEQRSAAWVEERLRSCGVSTEDAMRVAELVAATADHVSDDVAMGVLMDADLAILASPPDAYAAYVAAVRREYAHVPEDAWRTGRAHVLGTLLDRDHLFVTAPGRERWEAAARRNLRAELDDLTN